jgi:uncharacterized membrane protein YbhN (UPF0104 family)
MQVDGREVAVAGSLLQPLLRRGDDLRRLVLAALISALAAAGSAMVPEESVVALERSISRIVGVLSPDWSGRLYLMYGSTLIFLPLGILFSLSVARHWKILRAAVAAGLVAVVAVSRFLDVPGWVAMIAALLTVSGPWLSVGWRRSGWALLLAFGPMHLVFSAEVPAGSLLGLSVGWLVGAAVALVANTSALEVPVEEAVAAMAKRGFLATGLTVLRPAGRGPLIFSAVSDVSDSRAVIELYGPNHTGGGALRQVWRSVRLRADEAPPLQASLHRVVEHRALMAIAVADAGVANIETMAFTALRRGWIMYAHTPVRGSPIAEGMGASSVDSAWKALGVLHLREIAHNDLRRSEITVEDGSARFGGFQHAEFGATDAQLQSDIAQLLIATSEPDGSGTAVGAAIAVFGEDAVLAASGRLTKSALPRRIRTSVGDLDAVVALLRREVMLRTGAERIPPETVTRFSRTQIIQLVLLVALVYVAYPFLSTLPTFHSALKTANWWWVAFGLTASVLTYLGAATALWVCASRTVNFRRLVVVQVASTFAAVTTPAGVGGLALSARYLQKNGQGSVRATAAVALQQAVQVITHIALLTFFGVAAGVSADLSHFVPSATVLFLLAGAALGIVGLLMFVPRLRRWLGTSVRPRVTAVVDDLVTLARAPHRLALIVFGCATTTLGGALALWASIEAVGGAATFVTVTVVTMIGGTLASAAPTPGGVGAVEAALIGGLAAFGVPAAVAVPSVLLYRILTCWLPVFVGWGVTRWFTAKDMI